jgi:hypothetical protein
MSYFSGEERKGLSWKGRNELEKKRSAANFALGTGIQFVCIGLLLTMFAVNDLRPDYPGGAIFGIVFGVLLLLGGVLVVTAGCRGLRDLKEEDDE